MTQQSLEIFDMHNQNISSYMGGNNCALAPNPNAMSAVYMDNIYDYNKELEFFDGLNNDSYNQYTSTQNQKTIFVSE